MLTDTVEATTVGNTILLSKGLIDTMPDESKRSPSVIAMELAHIAMGHHIDTRYAFNDRLLFPDESTFQRINMYHSDHDNQEAAKTGDGRTCKPRCTRTSLPTPGFIWEQLADRGKVLKALNTPKLGDSLLKAGRDTVDGGPGA